MDISGLSYSVRPGGDEQKCDGVAGFDSRYADIDFKADLMGWTAPAPGIECATRWSLETPRLRGAVRYADYHYRS